MGPMLYQWFNVNKYRNKLPEKLNNCKTTLDAIRVMEAYLFAKYEAFIVSAGYSLPTSAGVFFIKTGDEIVKEDYLLSNSAEVKLFPIIGGGQGK